MTNIDIQKHAERIASSIPDHRRPGLLLLRANNSKTAIHGWAREFVRNNTREVLTRIATILTDILGLKKRRKYRKNAKLGNKQIIS